jgi:hypothetical protein
VVEGKWRLCVTSSAGKSPVDLGIHWMGKEVPIMRDNNWT